MIALQLKFERPVMASAITDLEEYLGIAADVTDEHSALFCVEPKALTSEALKPICERVRSTLELAVHGYGAIVELADGSRYRWNGSAWQPLLRLVQ